jgi:SOS-response transcriptional repressor LexA
MDSLGEKIRKQRRRLGLTLDELAVRSSISKPYLSLIETGRVPNPPSDEKLQRLEQALGFEKNQLVAQAHLHRTPEDVRAVLQQLLKQRKEQQGADGGASAGPVDLDAAYFSGVLAELAEARSSNVAQVGANAVPIINKVSAGYPREFTDLSYPKGVADAYLTCPDLPDGNAFAARVCGDSMSPKYREGDVVVFSPAQVPRSGDDCFVRFDDGQTTFKRVFFENDENGKGVLRLQPRNEKYRPQVLATEKVTGLYKALYRLQRVDDE